MAIESSNLLSKKNMPRVGLTLRPMDWGGCPKIDYFDGRLDKLHEKKEQHDVYSEFQTVSPQRIVENERLRNILDLYLANVENIGWESLSDEELNDVVLNSILWHNSYCEVSSLERKRYKAHYRNWKRNKKK